MALYCRRSEHYAAAHIESPQCPHFGVRLAFLKHVSSGTNLDYASNRDKPARDEMGVGVGVVSREWQEADTRARTFCPEMTNEEESGTALPLPRPPSTTTVDYFRSISIFSGDLIPAVSRVPRRARVLAGVTPTASRCGGVQMAIERTCWSYHDHWSYSKANGLHCSRSRLVTQPSMCDPILFP